MIFFFTVIQHEIFLASFLASFLARFLKILVDNLFRVFVSAASLNDSSLH